MSNKSRLQTNNTNLQALITKANNLPDAGSGGGGGSGGIETCTVSITSPKQASAVIYTSIVDGCITYIEDALEIRKNSITCENVIVGSCIIIHDNVSGYTISDVSVTDNITVLYTTNLGDTHYHISTLVQGDGTITLTR